MVRRKLCETIIEMENKKYFVVVPISISTYPNMAIAYIISIVFTFVTFIVKYNSKTYLLPKTISIKM